MTTDESENTKADAEATADDTEGHSLLNSELGRTINSDRARETDKFARDSARAHEAQPKREGGFFKRLGRR